MKKKFIIASLLTAIFGTMALVSCTDTATKKDETTLSQEVKDSDSTKQEGKDSIKSGETAENDTLTANVEQKENTTAPQDASGAVPVKELVKNEPGFHHTYLVADQNDEGHIYKRPTNKNKCFIVVSKRDYRLYVYEATAGDTSICATFPICYGLNMGQKQRQGDCKTPECDMQHPFKIMQIADYSQKTWNFKDGRGSILAYGHWFMRLDLSNSFPNNPNVARNTSIGIHGSTNNVESVPGRDSHGCIRLHNEDLNTLHDTYAHVGMKVVVTKADKGKLPFQLKAEQKLGGKYVAPTPGNPLVK